MTWSFRDVVGVVLPCIVLVVSVVVVLAPAFGIPVPAIQMAVAAICGTFSIAALIASEKS
jgi:hypothetical protein